MKNNYYQSINISISSTFVCLYILKWIILPSFAYTTIVTFLSVFFAEDNQAMADWGGSNDYERDHSNTNKRVSKDSSSSSVSSWSIPSSERKIIRANDITILPSSAPVDIPDWSKIYGVNGKKVMRDGDDDEDEDDGDRIPPHEWIARKLARSQISSFSVCEGMGRTLKGRDLSKVRNSILTKTGFIE